MNTGSTRGFYESTNNAIMNNKDYQYDKSKGDITKNALILLYKLRQIKETMGLSKLPLNLIYYDENLKDKGNENSDNCTFFQMHLTGTF